MFTQNETKINAVMPVPRQYLSLMSADDALDYAAGEADSAASSQSLSSSPSLSEGRNVQAFFGC